MDADQVSMTSSSGTGQAAHKPLKKVSLSKMAASKSLRRSIKLLNRQGKYHEKVFAVTFLSILFPIRQNSTFLRLFFAAFPSAAAIATSTHTVVVQQSPRLVSSARRRQASRCQLIIANSRP